MSALFKDELFHIGTDETCFGPNVDGQVGGCTQLVGQMGPCTNITVRALEEGMIKLAKALPQQGRTPGKNKTVMMWSEYGPGTQMIGPDPATVVQTWRGPAAHEWAAMGQRVVLTGENFVGGSGGGQGDYNATPAGIAQGYVNVTQHFTSRTTLPLLLGSEVTCWGDAFLPHGCPEDCSNTIGHAEVLYPPSEDKAFGLWAGGWLWPRTFVAAAAFYSYNASVDAAASPGFIEAVFQLNGQAA